MYFYCSKFGVERQVVFVEQRQLSIIYAEQPGHLNRAGGSPCPGMVFFAEIQQGIAMSAAGTKRKGHLQFARRLLNLVSALCAD